MQRKLVMLFMAVILAFVVLMGRIAYINLSRGSSYTRVVLDQQNYDSRVIAFKRGDIVDRNGTKIATSERVYNVILDVHVMTDKEEYIEPTKAVLEECFGIDGATIDALIEENPDSRYEILKKGIDYNTAQQFEAIDEDDEKYPNVKGIWLEDDYTRTYPYGSLASDVIGFTYSGNQGANGIESAYNSILNGTDGREYGYFDSESALERTVKPAKNGNTVVTTIDVTLQSIVEKCIIEYNQGLASDGNPGSKNTAVMIMNPNTGEILAEASYPNYDLNDPRDLSLLYTDEQWDKMSEEEQLDAMNSLWRNFCVSDAFEPGSTMKPFTVAAGLETGKLKGDETYYCGGSKNVSGTPVSCANRDGHGTETMQDAMVAQNRLSACPGALRAHDSRDARLARTFAEHHAPARLDNGCLLSGDLGKRVAEDLHVVETDAGDAHHARIGCARGVPAPAEAHLEHRDVNALPRRYSKRRNRQHVEGADGVGLLPRCSAALVNAASSLAGSGNAPGKEIVTDRSPADLDALVKAHELRTRIEHRALALAAQNARQKAHRGALAVGAGNLNAVVGAVRPPELVEKRHDHLEQRPLGAPHKAGIGGYGQRLLVTQARHRERRLPRLAHVPVVRLILGGSIHATQLLRFM